MIRRRLAKVLTKVLSAAGQVSEQAGTAIGEDERRPIQVAQRPQAFAPVYM